MRRGCRILLALVGVTLLSMSAAAGGFVDIGGGVKIGVDPGPNVTVTGSTSISIVNSSFPSSNTVKINTTDGNVTFTSAKNTSATVNKDDLEGTFTNVTGLNVKRAKLSIDPADKEQADVKGDTDAFAFRKAIQADDGKMDFFYNGTSGTTTVTVRGLAANTEYKAVDDDGTVLDRDRSDANGNVTFKGMTNSDHNVSIQTQDALTPDDEIVDSTDDSLDAAPVTRQTLLMLLLLTITAAYLVFSRPVGDAPALRVLGGAFVVVLWIVVAFFATEYVVVHVDGTTSVRSNDALSIMGGLAAAVQLLDVLRNGFALISAAE